MNDRQKNKTVELSCHCGEVKLILPHFVDVVTDCNCSICYRYAALWGYYEKNSYQVVGKKSYNLTRMVIRKLSIIVVTIVCALPITSRQRNQGLILQV